MGADGVVLHFVRWLIGHAVELRAVPRLVYSFYLTPGFSLAERGRG